MIIVPEPDRTTIPCKECLGARCDRCPGPDNHPPTEEEEIAPTLIALEEKK